MFTFKTEKPIGKYSSFEQPIYNIKVKKFKIGYIDPKPPHKIRLKVTKADINEDGNPNCKWKWAKLKKEFESVDEAKKFLNDHYKVITQKFNIHEEEE